MQNARCKHDVVCSIGVNAVTTFTPLSRTRVAFAFGIVHCALLAASCGKASPLLVTPPQPGSAQQLHIDLAAVTKMPGVQRATWGIAVQSLAGGARLFDLNPQTLMVPASVA